MNDYEVRFTNKYGTCVYGEFKIRDVRGQEEALIEARRQFLNDRKGSMNLPGFYQAVTVHISILE